MRAIVLNGSPHASGNGMRMAGWLLEDIASDISTVNLYDAGMAPCRGCAACGGINGCVLKDGAAETLGMAMAADCLVLVSPVHFSSLSAPLVGFISRLQMIWGGKKDACENTPGKGKSGVLLVSGGSDYPGMFEPARKVAAAAFKTMGREFTGMVCAPGTDEGAFDGGRGVRGELAGLAERIVAECGAGRNVIRK